VTPELADPLDAVEVWEAQDVKSSARAAKGGLEASPEFRLHFVEGHAGSASHIPTATTTAVTATSSSHTQS
jgi:hypothetical protein